MTTDINRELAEDAAEEYSEYQVARDMFVQGWLDYCRGDYEQSFNEHYHEGYIAARDAPDD